MTDASVLTTALLLVLYFPIKASRLPKALTKREPPKGGADDLTIDAVLGMVDKDADPRGALANDKLIWMVNLCTNMDAIASTETPRGDDHGSSSGSAATGLLPGFLLDCVQQNHQVTKIAQTMVGILRLGCPLLTVARGLALLHMLRHLIRLFPRLTVEELQNMRSGVEPLLLWAEPLGSSALATLHCIDGELALRASSMWLHLSHDAAWLGALDTAMLAKLPCLQALEEAFTVRFVINEDLDWARCFRKLFMTTDAEARAFTPRSSTRNSGRLSLSSLMGKGGGEAEETTPAGGAIVSALCSMLFALLHNAQPTVGLSPAKLAALQPTEVVQLSAQALRLVQLVSKGTPVAGALQKLAEAVNRLSATAGNKPGCTSKSDVQMTRMPTLTMRMLMPSEPDAFSEAQVRELREAAEICGHRRYMYNPLLAALHERLSHAVGLVDRGLAHPVRICVAGGDATLHRLLQAYVVLRCAYPQLCTRVDLAFYLIPMTPRNRLAQYIAENDAWYRRHIYLPHCRGHPTVPHLITPTMPARAVPDAAPAAGRRSPLEPLRQMVVDYLKDARAKLHVRLFEAQCWLSPPSTGTGAKAEAPFITIAFSSWADVVLTGGPGESGGNLTLEYTMADPYGVAYSSPTALSGRFTALSFNNVSLETGHSPTSGRLQMRCCHSSTSGKAASRIVESPLRHIKTATLSAGAATSANESLVRGRGAQQKGGGGSSNERFGLLVDGEYYGPFAHVQLTPCVPPGQLEVRAAPRLAMPTRAPRPFAPPRAPAPVARAGADASDRHLLPDHLSLRALCWHAVPGPLAQEGRACSIVGHTLELGCAGRICDKRWPRIQTR